jgi:hypothetical protein
MIITAFIVPLNGPSPRPDDLLHWNVKSILLTDTSEAKAPFPRKTAIYKGFTIQQRNIYTRKPTSGKVNANQKPQAFTSRSESTIIGSNSLLASMEEKVNGLYRTDNRPRQISRQAVVLSST